MSFFLIWIQSLEILHLFDSVQPCHEKIVLGTTNKQNNQVWAQLREYFGDYSLQHFSINEKPYYTSNSENGKYAIWYHSKYENRQWIIGLAKDQGTNKGYFFVNSRANCPYQTGFAWKYFSLNQRWESANQGFTIWYNVQEHSGPANTEYEDV